MPQVRKKRQPLLLIAVASLAAASILYLEFFADPIVDPPEFTSDWEFQVQYLTARSPFSRRVVFRLVTVDSLYSPSRYEFRGRDVRLDPPAAGAPETVVQTDCLVISEGQANVGLPETFDELWELRPPGGQEVLRAWLQEVAQRTRDLRLAQLTWPLPSGMD